MLQWKIYYGDGTTYSSADGPWESAPTRNVQFVLCPDPIVGRRIHSCCDYYLYRDGQPFGVDIFGLFDYLLEIGLVKFGRSLTRRDFDAIQQQVFNDPDFPVKSAWHPDEPCCPDAI